MGKVTEEKATAGRLQNSGDQRSTSTKDRKKESIFQSGK
jgi:hypothetical protein